MDADLLTSPPIVRKPGFGYRFRFEVNAFGLADISIDIPVLLFMEKLPEEVDVLVEPLHALASGGATATDFDFVTVSASTPLGILEQEAAQTALDQVIAGILAFPEASPEAFEALQSQELTVRLGLIEAVRRYRRSNPYRASNTSAGLLEFDVIALPEGGTGPGNPQAHRTQMAHRYHGTATTRLLSDGAGSTPFRLYLLE